MDINTFVYKPLKGSSYILLPKELADKKAITKIDQPSLGLPSREYYFPSKKTVLQCENTTNSDGETTKKCESVDDPNDNRTASEVFWDDENVQAYLKYMKAVTNAFGVENESLAEQQLKQMVNFEISLANATAPMSMRRNKTELYNKYTIRQLKQEFDQIDWELYFGKLFSVLPEDQRPGDSELVIVRQPSFYKQLNELVRNANQNPDLEKLLKNYMMVRLMKRTTGSLTKDLRKSRLEYSKVLYGIETEEARWKSCLSYVKGNLGQALGKLYVDQYFNEEAKDTALTMIRNIRETFIDLLEHVDWLDENTLERTKEKANAIVENIAYSELLKNANDLDKEYEGLTLPKGLGHFEYVQRIWNYTGVWDLQRLRKPVDKTKWHSGPAVVNAFYSSLQNKITFPAGILQPPFFVYDGPKSMNYGGIGMVIGHEITHGFDDRGRQTDKDGNVDNWWTPQVVENFVEASKCIVDQYSDFTMEALGKTWHLNGTNTQGENIADNGGMKQAYLAYKTWEKENGEEPRLPGLEKFSHDQLFFLAHASIWCSEYKPQSIVLQVRTGVHSPGQFRVKGTVTNSEHFAKAFNCPAGSKMNPKKKCKVW